MPPTFRAVCAVLLVAGLASASRPAGAESFHTCTGFIDVVPTTIATQGVWCMRKDLATAITSGAAITIATNNVTIDCNDFKLGGLAAGDATEAVGIEADNRINATVRHCNVRGFMYGTQLTGSGHAVVDSRFDSNTYSGIMASGDGLQIQGNRVSDTGGSTISPTINAAGITLATPTYSATVRDNTIDTVFSLGGTATGIAAGIMNGTVERNTISVLRPGGAGLARGIRVFYANSRLMIRDNVIATQPAESGIGVDCNGAFARDNMVSGLTSGYYEDCTDGGGNLAN